MWPIRALAITGMLTASMISLIILGLGASRSRQLWLWRVSVWEMQGFELTRSFGRRHPPCGCQMVPCRWIK